MLSSWRAVSRFPFFLLLLSGVGLARPHRTILEAPSADDACPAHEYLAPGELSCREKRDLEDRLTRFESGDPSAMDGATPKFSPARGVFISPKPELRLAGPIDDPLLQLAQVKGTDAYRKYYCEHFLKKHFPKLRCDEPRTAGRATVEDDDLVEDLLDGWVSKNSIAYSLDDIPAKGDTRLPIWGDDYWALQYGGLSYRYSTEAEFDNYKQAINAYHQPDEWKALLDLGLDFGKLTEKTIGWSPAEKYDLTVGDQEFGLTYTEKNAGMDMLNGQGDVEDWMGICDGWSGAAIIVPAPVKPVTLTGLGGMSVEWYPHDVRALASLLWAHADTDTNNVGGRCDAKYPKKYRNGRLKQQECFDTNPATFHLALGNLIGRAGAGFVMDNTFDYEVWNQPVIGYSFEYYNPLNPKERSGDWSKVAVPYDSEFKAHDRFQHPLTRGARNTRRRGRTKYDETGIKEIVGVIATVSYLEETDPVAGPTPVPDNVTRETMVYDLELHEENGALVPEGGEWHNNAHPDFLWLPRKGSSATTAYDAKRVRFTGDTDPIRVKGLTKLAHEAAVNNDVPLCKVVKTLVEGSSGASGYSCKISN